MGIPQGTPRDPRGDPQGAQGPTQRHLREPRLARYDVHPAKGAPTIAEEAAGHPRRPQEAKPRRKRNQKTDPESVVH